MPLAPSCLLALLVLAPLAPGQRGLEPGRPVRDALAWDRLDGAETHTYDLTVPDDTLFLRVELAAPRADLDLALVQDLDGWELEQWSEGAGGHEVLELHSFHADEVAPGRASVSVLYQLDEWPRWGDERLEQLAYSLEVTLVTADQARPLPFDVPLELSFDDRDGRAACFVFDLPEGAGGLRVDVLDTSGDVDLLLKRGLAPRSAAEADHLADAAFGRESLVLGAPGDLRPAAGRWFLLVFEEGGYETGPARVVLRASTDLTPPPEMLALPELPPVSGPAPHQLFSAVAQLFVPSGRGGGTGSAVLVSPDGLLLTAAHVVADLADEPLEEVVVAVCSDPRRPARPAYRAQVLVFDAERDLALLEIDRGLLGQPLPAGLSFPWLPLGAVADLDLGEPLHCVAYPGVGGLGSLVTLSVSGGVLSGYWGSGPRRMLKTDADIAPGSSGGALVDGRGRVVAIVTDTVEDAAASSSYARSIEVLPAGWRELIEERLP